MKKNQTPHIFHDIHQSFPLIAALNSPHVSRGADGFIVQDLWRCNGTQGHS